LLGRMRGSGEARDEVVHQLLVPRITDRGSVRALG
jgi:hypothetical protein